MSSDISTFDALTPEGKAAYNFRGIVLDIDRPRTDYMEVYRETEEELKLFYAGTTAFLQFLMTVAVKCVGYTGSDNGDTTPVKWFELVGMAEPPYALFDKALCREVEGHYLLFFPPVFDNDGAKEILELRERWLKEYEQYYGERYNVIVYKARRKQQRLARLAK